MNANDFQLGLLALAIAGCGTDSPLVGTERGPCYRNNTCNAGLVCLSELCVHLPEAGIPSIHSDASSNPQRDGKLPDMVPQPPGPNPWDGGKPPGPNPPGPDPWDGGMPPNPPNPNPWDGGMPPDPPNPGPWDGGVPPTPRGPG